MAKLFMDHKDEEAIALRQKVESMSREGDISRIVSILRQEFSHEKKGWLDARLESVFLHLRSLA